jgi:hypothetical protein
MRTFASFAVLSMMLAGTALAQSSVTANQSGQGVAPGGATFGTGTITFGSAPSYSAGATSESGDSAASTGMKDGAEASAGASPGSSEQQAATGSESNVSASGSTSASGVTAGTGSDAAGRSGASTATGTTGMKGSAADAMTSRSQAQLGGQDWKSDKALVRQVQMQLKQGGYEVGAVDGIYGPRTQQALREFQRDKGHEVTGEIDPQLLAEMNIDVGGQTAVNPRSDQVGGTQPPVTEQQTQSSQGSER